MTDPPPAHESACADAAVPVQSIFLRNPAGLSSAPGVWRFIMPFMTEKELSHQHAVYSYGSLPLTLMYSPTATAAWEVYFGGEYLGLVEETHLEGELWPAFVAHLPGEEEIGGGTSVADWRVAVELLAAHAGL